MSKASQDVSAGFKKLNADIYASEHPVQLDGDSKDPQMVILFGWMGAKLAHVQKYAGQYRSQYPNASIAIVQSRMEHFFDSVSKREQSFLPLIDFLKQNGLLNNRQPRIVIHTFSNGGSFQLMNFSRMLAKVLPEHTPGQIALVFDSLPGYATLSETIVAVSASTLPSPMRSVLVALVTLIFACFIVIDTIRGKKSWIQDVRATLNDPNLLPWTTKNTPRLYLYSDGDKMISTDAVEEHMAGAKEQGLRVSAHKFKGSPHVSHARMYTESYWAEVKSIWNETK